MTRFLSQHLPDLLSLPTLRDTLAGPIAQQDRLSREELAQTFRDYLGGTGDADMTWLLIGLGLVFCLIGCIYTVNWLKQRRHASNPIAVFKNVARKISMHPSDQHLLIRIARHRNLPSPLTLIVSDRTLTHHAHFYAQGLPPRMQPKVYQQVAQIRKFLFDPQQQGRLTIPRKHRKAS